MYFNESSHMNFDKFILAIAALGLTLLIIVGGGLAAGEYLKSHPQTFQPTSHK